MPPCLATTCTPDQAYSNCSGRKFVSVVGETTQDGLCERFAIILYISVFNYFISGAVTTVLFSSGAEDSNTSVRTTQSKQGRRHTLWLPRSSSWSVIRMTYRSSASKRTIITRNKIISCMEPKHAMPDKAQWTLDAIARVLSLTKALN